MERTLRRYKSNTFPSSPMNGAGVMEVFQRANVNEAFGCSRHDKPTQFYKGTQLKADFENTFFASEQIIEMIKTNIPINRHYLMDATFKIVPIGSFRQLLVLYIEYIGKVRKNS